MKTGQRNRQRGNLGGRESKRSGHRGFVVTKAWVENRKRRCEESELRGHHNQKEREEEEKNKAWENWEKINDLI